MRWKAQKLGKELDYELDSSFFRQNKSKPKELFSGSRIEGVFPFYRWVFGQSEEVNFNSADKAKLGNQSLNSAGNPTTKRTDFIRHLEHKKRSEDP